MKSYAKLFDESREALLELVASGVEAYYRQRTALEKTLPDVLPEDEPSKGDFLHDFVSLNVQYLNQLARLGSNYSILGARALERIYSWMQPPEPENHLVGKAGTPVAYTFTVHNRAAKKQRLRCRTRPFSDGQATLRMKCTLIPNLVEIKPGESKEVTVNVEISRRQKPGVDYHGSVIARLGTRETEHVIVVRRES